MLNDRRIQAALAGLRVGGEVHYVETVGSTNDLAMELGRAGYGDGLVVVAGEQTSGRGRRGSRWVSEAGKALTISILLEPDFLPKALWRRLTLMAALALCRGVERRMPEVQLGIKWPNDVLVGDKKLAGILAETCVVGGRTLLVIGMGVNVGFERGELGEVEEIATSLAIEAGGGDSPSVEGVVIELIREFDGLYERCGDAGWSGVLEEVRARSVFIGREVRFIRNGREETGLVIGLDDEGGLMVRGADGRVEVVTSADRVRGLT